LLALAVRRLTGTPYICYAHGEEVNLTGGPESGAGHRGMMASRELRWLTGTVLRNADFVVANSRNTHAILRSDWHLESGQVRLLHPGADTERFRPARTDPVLRRQLGWNNRKVILTVSRLQWRKGHDQMVRALPELLRAVPDALYALAGDGEERPRLEALVRQLGLREHVSFLGPVTEDRLVQSYQQCDLFVLPNRQCGQDIEGFGMVLLEAQACGKPVVAGPSGGTAETMDVPHTGLLATADRPEEYARLGTALLRDDARRAAMGRAARAWAVEHFDWTVQVARAGEIFGIKTRATPASAVGEQTRFGLTEVAA
jgi:phosphatidylinositol alpha-1,6-mannosyltransferase